NIAAQAANNIAINNIGGVLHALQGSINIRDASFSGKADTSIYGGNILSKQLNIESGCGNINLDVNDINGTLNAFAGAIHTRVSSGDLHLGTLQFSGDPTFYNDDDNNNGGNI